MLNHSFHFFFLITSRRKFYFEAWVFLTLFFVLVNFHINTEKAVSGPEPTTAKGTLLEFNKNLSVID